MNRTCALTALFFVVTTGVAGAQEVSTPGVPCLPNEANQLVISLVQPEVRGSDEVRLYFRRLNPTGAFYWTTMNPSGDGAYWAVFPKPEEREQQDLTDEWWEILEGRDWMEGHDRQWLEDYFDEQQFELSEYYIAVVDISGAEVARTPTSLVEVRDPDDCAAGLNPFEVGQARNLAIGETTELQQGREVYHWLCDGIVSRVDFEGILREDEYCRACVVAAWLPVVPAGAALIAGSVVVPREPPRASEVQPTP
jgi:hypothetical protein